MKIISPFMKQLIFLFLACTLALTSCKDDEVKADDGDDSDDETTEEYSDIDNWILENMEYWYLWEEDLPSVPDLTLDPESFFSSLLYTDDRFSWIEEDYEELLNSLSGINMEAGYEVVLFREDDDAVVAQIRYIKPDSPAEEAGLARGDIITHINGEQMTLSNYSTLIYDIYEDHTITYRPFSVENQTFGDAETVSLSVVEYAEDPNFLSKVIETNGHTVGYYMYNFFSSGTDDVYDDEMDAVFASFQAEGITDLVLDLRYNSGGSETSAINLASNIGVGISSSATFFTKEYNDIVEEYILSSPSLGESYLTTEFDTKANNVGGQLSEGRVYVLTSYYTASASELVVNGLLPYMDVYMIGDTTYGKNVGSVSIYEEDDPDNTWGMQPIVVKVYNSNGASDYSEGFVPDIVDLDNSLLIYPLGDEREELLSLALEQITGVASNARKESNARVQKQLGTSLEVDKKRFNLIIDKSVPAME